MNMSCGILRNSIGRKEVESTALYSAGGISAGVLLEGYELKYITVLRTMYCDVLLLFVNRTVYDSYTVDDMLQ